MLSERLQALFSGWKRRSYFSKPASPVTLPFVHDPGITVRVTTIDRFQQHSTPGGFRDMLDYVIGFALIGLVVLGGYYWLQQRDFGQPAVSATSTTKYNETNPNAAHLTDTRPVATHVVAAQYTAWARSGAFHGKILVAVTVDANGVPVKLIPTARIPFDLEPSVRAALMQWRFRPAQSQGRPVQAQVVVEVPFR